MTVTLTCAFCGRKESHGAIWQFTGWWELQPVEGRLIGKWIRRFVCSPKCGEAWFIEAGYPKQEAPNAP